jgi:hypothetical protein
MINGSHEIAAWAASSDVAAVVETEFVVISHVSKKLANQRHQRGRELTLGHESIRFQAPTATPAGARRRRAPTMTTPLNFASDPEARVMYMLKLFEWCGGGQRRGRPVVAVDARASSKLPDHRHAENSNDEEPQHADDAEFPVIAELVAARAHDHQVYRRGNRREERCRRGNADAHQDRAR